MQELLKMSKQNHNVTMRALSTGILGHIILGDSPYKDQPQAVLLAILARNPEIELAYQLGLKVSGAPDDNYIVVLP